MNPSVDQVDICQQKISRLLDKLADGEISVRLYTRLVWLVKTEFGVKTGCRG